MKIDADLRAIVKARAKINREPTWQERNEIRTNAVKQWLAENPEVAKRFEAAAVQINKLKKARQRPEKVINDFGINASKYAAGELVIYDEELLEAAGCILPVTHCVAKATEEEILSKLAAAKTQEEFDAVLAKYDISWN